MWWTARDSPEEGDLLEAWNLALRQAALIGVILVSSVLGAAALISIVLARLQHAPAFHASLKRNAGSCSRLCSSAVEAVGSVAFWLAWFSLVVLCVSALLIPLSAGLAGTEDHSFFGWTLVHALLSWAVRWARQWLLGLAVPVCIASSTFPNTWQRLRLSASRMLPGGAAFVDMLRWASAVCLAALAVTLGSSMLHPHIGVMALPTAYFSDVQWCIDVVVPPVAAMLVLATVQGMRASVQFMSRIPVPCIAEQREGMLSASMRSFEIGHRQLMTAIDHLQVQTSRLSAPATTPANQIRGMGKGLTSSSAAQSPTAADDPGEDEGLTPEAPGLDSAPRATDSSEDTATSASSTVHATRQLRFDSPNESSQTPATSSDPSHDASQPDWTLGPYVATQPRLPQAHCTPAADAAFACAGVRLGDLARQLLDANEVVPRSCFSRGERRSVLRGSPRAVVQRFMSLARAADLAASAAHVGAKRKLALEPEPSSTRSSRERINAAESEASPPLAKCRKRLRRPLSQRSARESPQPDTPYASAAASTRDRFSHHKGNRTPMSRASPAPGAALQHQDRTQGSEADFHDDDSCASGELQEPAALQHGQPPVAEGSVNTVTPQHIGEGVEQHAPSMQCEAPGSARVRALQWRAEQRERQRGAEGDRDAGAMLELVRGALQAARDTKQALADNDLVPDPPAILAAEQACAALAASLDDFACAHESALVRSLRWGACLVGLSCVCLLLVAGALESIATLAVGRKAVQAHLRSFLPRFGLLVLGGLRTVSMFALMWLGMRSTAVSVGLFPAPNELQLGRAVGPPASSFLHAERRHRALVRFAVMCLVMSAAIPLAVTGVGLLPPEEEAPIAPSSYDQLECSSAASAWWLQAGETCPETPQQPLSTGLTAPVYDFLAGRVILAALFLVLMGHLSLQLAASVRSCGAGWP